MKNADTEFVADATRADSYPSFLAGEGSILSCRYGIHFYAKDEFVPRKAQPFAAALATAAPTMPEHKVELERFDVYYNYQLRLGKFVAESGDGQVIREQEVSV